VRATPWSGTDEELTTLQAKIHNYVGFALDGQLVATYPETQDLPWRIVVVGQAGPPDERTLTLLGTLCEPIRAYGGDLLLSSLNGGDAT
jgi:hypothetical protein